jgi:hypothetical protein
VSLLDRPETRQRPDTPALHTAREASVARAQPEDDETTSYSLFQRSWWLDTVAPGRWDEAVVRHGSETVARLPYYVTRRHGVTRLGQPPLTHFLGPWLRASRGKYVNQIREQRGLLEELVAALPPFDSFAQNFSPAVTNWLPFHWAGFESQTRYTYVLEDLTDLAAVWAGMSDNIRRDVRKAEKVLAVETGLDPERFVHVLRLTFERQGLPLPYSEPAIRAVLEACERRGCGESFFAIDSSAQIHGVIFVVWDSTRASYLLSGSHPELRHSGAMSLLLWRAIQHAAGRSRVFDFEGSMLKSVERHIQAFGGRQVPYLGIRKSNTKARAVTVLGSIAPRALPFARWPGRVTSRD